VCTTVNSFVQQFLRIRGAAQEIGDDLFAEARIGDDVIEIRHQQRFRQHREVRGRAGIQVDRALADDVGVVGGVRMGMARQGAELLSLDRLEFGAGFRISHLRASRDHLCNIDAPSRIRQLVSAT